MITNLDNLPCYFFAINEQRVITDCNDTLAHDLQYSIEEIIGLPVETIFTIATRIFYQTHFGPLLKLQDTSSEIFITLKARQGKILSVLCNAKNGLQDDKSVTFFISIALKNRKKFEDELIEARVAAERALNENVALKNSQEQLQRNLEILDANLTLVNRQNEELKQFNHVVTHELQEPLRKINVFTGMLNAEQNNAENRRLDLITKIMRATGRMRSVVEGLQNYVWLTGKKLQSTRVNLSEIISVEAEKLNSGEKDVRLIVKSGKLDDIHAIVIKSGCCFMNC